MAVLSTLKHHGSYDRTCLIYDNLCLYITVLYTGKYGIGEGSLTVKIYVYFYFKHVHCYTVFRQRQTFISLSSR